MCGIHGIYRFDGLSVEPGILSAMGDRTRHRGPDDEGSHVDGPCGIAMRRLSIIDLAGGHQPLSNADETLWLVCNGEIYNFRELRGELQAKGYRFKTGSDCEVLLHLYDAEGDLYQLFRLDQDPGEKDDRYRAEPEPALRMRDAMKRFRSERLSLRGAEALAPPSGPPDPHGH